MRALLLWLLTAAGFVSVSFAVRALVPWPKDQGLSAKWVYFQRHKDEFDAVWIGSSLTFRDVDAPSIDAALAERGHDFHSFNFGVGGMFTFEQDYVLHRLLELEPANLKYVILEGGPVRFSAHPDLMFQARKVTNTMRGTHWHDATRVGYILSQAPHVSMPLWSKTSLAFTHLRLLGRRFSNYGFGPEIARTLPAFEPGPWLTQRRGFHQYKEPHGDEIQTLLDDPAAYQALLELIPAASTTPMELDDIDLGLHRAQYAATEERGIELIYLVLPASVGDAERQFLHRQGVIPVLWDFGLPADHPELFRLEHRWDKNHLNPDGVEYLTPLLVERIARHLEARE